MPSRSTRIALVTHSMRCGGLETVVLRLGRYLSTAGVEVEVLTTFQPGEWFGKIREWGLDGDHVDGAISSFPCMPLVHSIRISRRLSEGRFDVVLLNHAAYAQASIALLPDRVVAIPILHNDADFVYKVGCANPESVNALVGVSPKICEVARAKVEEKPVIEILNGVDTPGRGVWEKRAGFSRPMILLFVGRVDQAQKNVMLLPPILKAALERGVDARLRIVGDGPDKDLLMREFSLCGVLDRVDDLGAVPPEEVYPILLNGHILLLPSFHEGLPIVALEAQACGCVPVASFLPGITDIAVLDRNTGILVRTLDPASFADAICELNDHARWSWMSEAAHRHVLSGFSVEAMGRRYVRLIEDALEGRYPLPRPRRFQTSAYLSLFPPAENIPGWMRRIGDRFRYRRQPAST